MKRIIRALVFLLLCMWMPCASALSVNASGAALLEQSTGRVLWSQNGDVRLPMASTTKIMTALCVLENTALDDVVTIDKRCVGVEGSSIYLEEGEQLTVEDLLYGLMQRSGNDAAEALALHTAGSVEEFVEIMNRTAADLGLTDTHFANPHGLPVENHYTTAEELGRIACAAYDLEPFKQIVSTKRKVVPWTGHEYDRAMLNKNKILTLYEGGNGVKTGYTKAAGRCLVSGAERGGMQLIAVVLNAPDMWNDSMAMLDWGFQNVHMEEVLTNLEPVANIPCTFTQQNVPVLPERCAALPLLEDESYWTQFELPENISTTVARGDVLGYAILGVNKDVLDVVPLVAGESVSVPSAGFPDIVQNILKNWYIH